MELGVRSRSPNDQVYESKAARTRSNQCLVAVRENEVPIVDNVGYFWIPDLPPKPPSNLYKNHQEIKARLDIRKTTKFRTSI
jgi:hypothetical protein